MAKHAFHSTHVYVEHGNTAAEVADQHPNRNTHVLGEFPARGHYKARVFVLFWRGRKPSADVVSRKAVEAGLKIEGLRLP